MGRRHSQYQIKNSAEYAVQYNVAREDGRIAHVLWSVE